MAVFEKKAPRKVYLDDTQALTCTFENTQNIQGHTEYIIRVQRGPLAEKSWHIYKRYNDFVSLHNILQASGLPLPLPPKKLIGNMDREFVAERQSGLQNYLNIVLMNPILASSLPMRKFLDPENYSTPFQEVALQQVSMALRSEQHLEVVRPVAEMGWRLRKHYFLVKRKGGGGAGASGGANGGRGAGEELLLSWAEHGPDKYLEDKALQATLRSLASIQHPNVQPMEYVSCNEVGGFVIRRLSVGGSLRDVLCCAKPKVSFLKKYGNPKQVQPLPLEDIARYGRQLLEVLKFLHDKGLPYGHLQTGNVLLEESRARLLDLENGVLGLPSYYRPFFLQHKRISTLEAIDVYCFGHVLYEMAFGHPLHAATCDHLPPTSCPLLKSVLESILSVEACKKGLPTLPELLAHLFFNGTSSAPVAPPERAHLKFPSHVKEALKAAWQKTEMRVREEQKMVRHQKRLARVQELLTSESEEGKRRKQQQQQQGKHHDHSSRAPSRRSSQPSQLATQQVPPPPPSLQQPLPVANGKSPERSESPNSTSTGASASGTVTPPSGLTDGTPRGGSAPPERSALLSAICGFNKSALRHATTKEADKPHGQVHP